MRIENLIPRQDVLEALAPAIAMRAGSLQNYAAPIQGVRLDAERTDAPLGQVWAEFLRHYHAKVLEHKYPNLPAAAGEILPIDSSMDPAATEYVYYVIDSGGYADWLGDDNAPVGNSWMSAERFTGKAHEVVSGYPLNFFELETAALASKGAGPKVAIDSTKSKQDRRNHEAWADWVWSFGAPEKQLPGLFTHPNITVSLAPLNAAANSRLSANKSNDEIAADFELLINTIATQTLDEHHATVVYVSHGLQRLMHARRLGQGDGLLTLWDWITKRWSGDETGQGKVTFKLLNYCDPERRRHPKYNSDRSGISGEFMFAMDATIPKDEAHFMRPRPYTQRPPELQGFNTWHATHSKIGGAVLKRPLAYHRVDFGTV